MATNHAQQKITTQQVLSFIQSKIAETHAAGEDILSLLGNPEIAFSLQILDGKYDNLKQAPVNQVAEENKKSGTEQLFMTTDANTNIGASQTTGLLF